MSRAILVELLTLLTVLDARAPKPIPYVAQLFDKQREFIDDPAKLKAAVCTRRAGKTTVCAEYMLETACKMPGVLIPYITLTRQNAKNVMWKELRARLRANNIPAKFNETELIVTLPNGSQIWLLGAMHADDMERLRAPKYPLAVVDECASFGPHFKQMIEEVIEPALVDYDGTLVLVGTPGAICDGAFYDATTKSDSPYSVHRWSILDNPFIPNARAWLERRKKARGWTDTTPAYMREWLGMWVRDEESLVWRFDRDRNVWKAAPAGNLIRVCGIDFGWTDQTAFVVLGFSENDPHVYVEHTFARSGLTVSDIVEEYNRLNRKYQFDHVVADSGGLGKTIIEEMRKRFGIPVRPAEKSAKADFIELANSDISRGLVQVNPAEEEFIDEVRRLQWDEKKLPKRVEDQRYPNHRSDAFAYAYRLCRHFLYTERENPPAHGSDEYYRAIEDRMVAQLEQDIRKENQESEEWQWS